LAFVSSTLEVEKVAKLATRPPAAIGDRLARNRFEHCAPLSDWTTTIDLIESSQLLGTVILTD
jgi:hypothetical protein